MSCVFAENRYGSFCNRYLLHAKLHAIVSGKGGHKGFEARPAIRSAHGH